jgi:LPXTG-motif cell wall-anchored protein
MKHLAVLAAIYALVAALVLPSSLLASEDADPAAAETPATETAPVEEAPAAPTEPAPERPAPVPTPEPAPSEQPAAAPEQPVAAPEPEPARKSKDRAAARAAANGAVTIVDFEFQPGSVTIDQGDTVTWTNNGPTAHSATAPDGSFDTGIFPAGQSRSHTFNEAGTYSYICTPHPNMQGTIVVRASQAGGGDTPDSSTGDGGGGTGGSSDSGTGAESAQTDTGSSLPSTGSDSGAMLVLGALMLLLGAAVHRRARAEEPRPAGRIGW